MDVQTQEKWDRASRAYDFFGAVDNKRLGLEKQRLLAKAQGKTLHVAAGTGNDFKFFPPGMHIVSIDISPKMLEKAKIKAAAYKEQSSLVKLMFAALTIQTRLSTPSPPSLRSVRYPSRSRACRSFTAY